jgi:glutathione S-transferase
MVVEVAEYEMAFVERSRLGLTSRGGVNETLLLARRLLAFAAYCSAHAGIPIELEKVDLAKHKTEGGQDYLTVNPKGYIPALRLDDGSILTEGPAIVQYLADQKLRAVLRPRQERSIAIASRSG